MASEDSNNKNKQKKHNNEEQKKIRKRQRGIFKTVLLSFICPENEFSFSTDVNMLISQIEIYDQLWVVRHGMNEKRHSVEATDLVRRFIKALDNVPDGCAELFPFNIIEELREEYL